MVSLEGYYVEGITILKHKPGPWICAGDFNDILFQHEKQGSVAIPQTCMEKF
jgi:hypothetical protein